MAVDLTIAICTRDNADSLRQTLDSVAGVDIPPDTAIEMVLVDNGSTDHTRAVMDAFDHSVFEVRTFVEPRPGVSRARNKVLAEARGDILLWTDDDLRVPDNWITGMTAPILAGEADAVAGGVEIAPHLRRPWMTLENVRVLASTKNMDPDDPPRILGANMAFARHVLDAIPAFDPELGAGALGFEEETLFTYQLKEAGFKIETAFDIVAEHHFDPNRLKRGFFLKAMRRMGESQAYVWHHWYHEDRGVPRILAGLCRTWLELQYNRLVHYYDGGPAAEGMPTWEQTLLKWFHQHRYTLTVRNHPRKYDYKGLVKKHAGAHSPHRPEPVSVVGRASQQPSET